jgi:uncharacterized protein (UPF0333 family)
MANPRSKVFSVAFAMLALASVFLISNAGEISANAWALLALTGVFAAGAVIAFFQENDDSESAPSKSTEVVNNQQTDAQQLPDPVDVGFDIPVV